MITSTFIGFSTAQRALQASQRAIDVAGQNLSNINTEGYTRQRLDLASIMPPGVGSTVSIYDSRVGQGVEMLGVTQIRDPYLDVQYRNQMAKVGTADAMDAALERLGTIFDETDSLAVRNALNEVISQLNGVANPSTASEGISDVLIRSAFETLINISRQKGVEVEEYNQEMIIEFQDSLIPSVNNALEKIIDLNIAIKNSEVLSSPALELMDERNMLIDELATYLPIDVKYHNSPDGNPNVKPLEITFTDVNGIEYTIIDDDKGSVFSFTEGIPATLPMPGPPATFGTPAVPATLTIDPVSISFSTPPGAPAGPPYDITDIMQDGLFKGKLDMLNKSQIFDGTDIKGVGYYEQMLNTFIHGIATTMNDLNAIQDPGPPPTEIRQDLFTTSDGSSQFTALNINISDDWMNETVSLTVTQSGGNNAYENILKMVSALSKDEYEFQIDSDYDGVDDTVVFTGTLQEIYDNIQNVQAIERSSSSIILSNRITVLNRISDTRDAVSGVNQDEEVIDLMRFQQSYNAASRLMTTLDEVLDKLINGTGVVGR